MNAKRFPTFYDLILIMHISTRWSCLVLAATALAMPVLTCAQAPADDVANTPPPPQTMKLEEGEAPEVTITQPGSGEQKITQQRQQGKVTEVKVQTGRTTYYVKPNDTPGAMRGDAQSDNASPAQFQIGEFGLPKQQEAEEGAQTLQPAPAKK